MKKSLLLYNLKLNCLIFSTGLNGSRIIFIRTYTVNCRNALDRLRLHMNIILLTKRLGAQYFHFVHNSSKMKISSPKVGTSERKMFRPKISGNLKFRRGLPPSVSSTTAATWQQLAAPADARRDTVTPACRPSRCPTFHHSVSVTSPQYYSN